MGDTVRKFEIAVGSSYQGAGLKSATADVAKLRHELSLPVMGPLSRQDQAVESAAVAHIRGMEKAADKSRVGEILREKLYGPAGAALPDLSAKDFGRSDSTASLPKELTKSSDYFKDLKGRLKAFDDALKVIRGGGAIGALGLAAQSLENFTGKLRDLATEARVSGIPLSRAEKADAAMTALPFVGSFWQAGKNIREILTGDQAEEDRKQMLKDEHKANVDRQAAFQQDRALKLKEGNEQLKTESLQARLLDLRGDARGRAEAGVTLAQKNRDIDLFRDEAKAKKLGPDEQAELERQVTARRLLAQNEFQAKMRDLDMERARRTQEEVKQIVQWNQEAEDSVRQHHQEGVRADLEIDGRFYESKQQAIRDTTDNYIKELERQKSAEVDALKADYASGKTDSFVTDDPDRRFREKKAAAEEDARKQSAQLKQQQDREIADADRAHKQGLLDGETDLAERRLRILGKGFDAEKLGIAKAYEDRLYTIKENLGKEIEAHREREPDLRRQAAEDARAAGEAFALDNEDADRRRRLRFRPDLPNTVGGESRLLTGGLGIRGATDPLFDPVNRTAKASESTNATIKEMKKSIDGLVSALTAKTSSVKVFNPT